MRLKSTQLLCNDHGKVIMGNGRMKIMASLEATGSINQTAKDLKMAYKTVWSKLKSTEKNFGSAIVITNKKDGTRLTDEGRALLEKYRLLKKRCIQADDAIFEDIF